MDPIDLYRAVDRRCATTTERYGQACFNALHNIDPALADRIRDTDADPFYDNDNATAFWFFVVEAWLR